MPNDNQLPATQHVESDALPLAISEGAVPVRALAAERITDVLPAVAYERIGQMVLTDKAEEILNEPLPDDEVDIRPDGLIYASHEYVVRQLNRAFGRMGWTLVPGSPLTRRPESNPPEYFQRWVLFVGGVYCSEALSSAIFYDNGLMTLDDCAEKIKSDCKRRTTKDLGIGTECWNRRFQKRIRDEQCVQVVVQTSKGNVKQWRRIDADPLKGELGTRSEEKKGQDNTVRAGSTPNPPGQGEPRLASMDTAGTVSPQSTARATGDSRTPPPTSAPAAAPTRVSAQGAGNPRRAGNVAPDSSLAEHPYQGPEKPNGTTAPSDGPPVSNATERPATPASDSPKPMRGGLLPLQERHIWARARAAGLAVGDDASALLDFLVEARDGTGSPFTTIVPLAGRTSGENVNALMKGLQGFKLTALLKQIDAAKVHNPKTVEPI